MNSIQLNITGMKCGGCVNTVENILKNSDGVQNVSVNLLTESAYFEINKTCLLYTSPSPRDQRGSRMPSSA